MKQNIFLAVITFLALLLLTACKAEANGDPTPQPNLEMRQGVGLLTGYVHHIEVGGKVYIGDHTFEVVQVEVTKKTNDFIYRDVWFNTVQTVDIDYSGLVNILEYSNWTIDVDPPQPWPCQPPPCS